MSKTKIQWTEYNWNPFTGCTPLSPGCVNCYARKNARRLKSNPFTDKYKDEFKFRFHPEYLDKPLQWKKPRKIFVNTMSDTFHEDAPLEAIQQIFERMVKCPQHIFQVLTKRAERMAELSVKLRWPANVWVGVTVENADYLHRLDFLRQVPARVRFISFEPLLSAIPNINFQDIHWAIVGGESGPKARPMNLDWARDIREQCGKAGVPFFFKQVGGKGRDKGGRLLDDQEWNEYPDTNDTAAPESDAADVEGPSSFAEQRGLRPLSDVEKPPIIEHFDRKNPHPTLKKTRKKEADEMPKEKKPDAGAEQNTVKKGSEEEQQTTPAVVGETAPAEDTAPTVDAKLIEEAVRFINEKYNETVYKGALEIGAYVLKHFFNDDIALASSRNPRKATSYRALCQADGLIPRPETLSVMVRVAAQEKFFLSKKLETESLSYTHKAELVKLPNNDEKVKLVKSAIKKALTTRQLEEKIEAIKKQQVREPKPIAALLDSDIGNPKKLFGEAAVLQLLEDKGGLQQELKQLKPKKLKALSVKATQRAEETKKWAQLYQDLVDAIEEMSGKE